MKVAEMFEKLQTSIQSLVLTDTIAEVQVHAAIDNLNYRIEADEETRRLEESTHRRNDFERAAVVDFQIEALMNGVQYLFAIIEAAHAPGTTDEIVSFSSTVLPVDFTTSPPSALYPEVRAVRHAIGWALQEAAGTVKKVKNHPEKLTWGWCATLTGNANIQPWWRQPVYGYETVDHLLLRSPMHVTLMKQKNVAYATLATYYSGTRVPSMTHFWDGSVVEMGIRYMDLTPTTTFSDMNESGKGLSAGWSTLAIIGSALRFVTAVIVQTVMVRVTAVVATAVRPITSVVSKTPILSGIYTSMLSRGTAAIQSITLDASLIVVAQRIVEAFRTHVDAPIPTQYIGVGTDSEGRGATQTRGKRVGWRHPNAPNEQTGDADSRGAPTWNHNAAAAAPGTWTFVAAGPAEGYVGADISHYVLPNIFPVHINTRVKSYANMYSIPLADSHFSGATATVTAEVVARVLTAGGVEWHHATTPTNTGAEAGVGDAVFFNGLLVAYYNYDATSWVYL
jgi:hypothetical protein